MTKDELFEEMELTSTQANAPLTIDPITREITIPESEQVFGVESDEKAERKYFSCPKIVGDNIDLSTLGIRIAFKNANGEEDEYICEDVKEQGENVTFSWLLSRKATKFKGKITFIVKAVRALEDGTIQNEWNTTLAQGNTKEGLPIKKADVPQAEKDIIQQLLDLTKRTSAEAVEAVKAEGEKQKGILEKVVDLDKLQIKEKAIGKTINVSDSAEFPFVDYKVFGETEQVVSSGINLLDVDNFIKDKVPSISNGELVQYNNGASSDFIQIKPNTDYVLSCKHLGASAYVYVLFYDASKKYINIHKSTREILNLTASELNNVKYIRVRIDSVLWIEDVMLAEGSVPKPYEPYTGGKLSPSIEVPSPLINKSVKNIKVLGSNLFDESRLTGSNRTELTRLAPNALRIKSIRANEGDGSYNAYYSLNNDEVNFLKGKSIKVYYETENKLESMKNALIQLTIQFKNGKLVYVTFTGNGGGIQFSGDIANITIELYLHNYNTPIPVGTYIIYKNVRIVLSETENTDWEQYKEQVVTLSQPITLNGMKVESNGNYTDEKGQQWLCDYIDLKSKEFVQVLKEEQITLQKRDITYNNSKYRYTSNGFFYENVTECMSDKFSYHSNAGNPKVGGVDEVGIRVAPSANAFVAFDNFSVPPATIDTNVVYAQKNAIRTPLPLADQQALEKLHTFYPNTVIMTNDSTGQELTYVADPKNYIDKKLKQIVQANVRSTANLLSLMPLDTQASMIENDTNKILNDMEV